MSAQAAAHLTRWWTRLYTLCMPPEQRERRRAEVESDIWESLRDPVGSRQILPRLLLGVADDVSWSITHMEPTSRSSLWWSVGSLLVFVAVASTLIYAPDSEVMREAIWAWPTAAALHVVGIVTLIALRLLIDLRMIGLRWPFGGVSMSTLARRVTPWTAIAALLTLATGLALYAVDPGDLAANSMFQIKIAVLALALVNVWYCHAVALRDAAQGDPQQAPTPAARASGYLSLTLWAVLIGVSLLVPYTA
jgi:hypothetical protein